MAPRQACCVCPKIIATKVLKNMSKPDEETEALERRHKLSTQLAGSPVTQPSLGLRKSHGLFFAVGLTLQPRWLHSLGTASARHIPSPCPCHQQDTWKFSGMGGSLIPPPSPTPSLPGPPQLCRGGNVRSWHQGGCRLEINSNQSQNHSVFSLCSEDSVFAGNYS